MPRQPQEEALYMDFLGRITADPNICHGKPCFRGTRVMVSIVLDSLAAGMTAEGVLDEYPTLKAQDIQAAQARRATHTP